MIVSPTAYVKLFKSYRSLALIEKREDNVKSEYSDMPPSVDIEMFFKNNKSFKIIKNIA
jgi:hypothetical protein